MLYFEGCFRFGCRGCLHIALYICIHVHIVFTKSIDDSILKEYNVLERKSKEDNSDKRVRGEVSKERKEEVEEMATAYK